MNIIKKYAELVSDKGISCKLARICGVIKVKKLVIDVPAMTESHNALSILDVYFLGIKVWHQVLEIQSYGGWKALRLVDKEQLLNHS